MMARKKKTELIEEPKVEKLTEEPKVEEPKATEKPRKLSEVVIPRALRRL